MTLDKDALDKHTKIPSYPKVYNFGHRAIKNLFLDSVLVQEKIDGSQISFALLNGEVVIRSKGKHMVNDAPEKMFSLGVESILFRSHLLKPGYIYRGEYLSKPKHNVLAYDRVPDGFIIIYDVETSPSHYIGPLGIDEEAFHIGLESVPTYEIGKIDDASEIRKFLEKDSCLGGGQVEGVVAKSATLFALDGKALMGKHVSEAFREKHGSKKYRTSNKDIIQSLIERYRTEARWQKAVQHLREAGTLLEEPKDIGALIKEVNIDTQDECSIEIAEILYKWGWKQISRGITAGLPEWYKNQLMEKQFESKEEPSSGKEKEETAEASK